MVCSESSHTICTTTAAPPHPASLPYVTCWPKNASDSFYQAVCRNYFERKKVNRFRYCMLIHKSDSCRDAVKTMSDEGAFATHMGRQTLLEIISEARETTTTTTTTDCYWCKEEILNVLERYCSFAFVLDGTQMTCGAIPSPY